MPWYEYGGQFYNANPDDVASWGSESQARLVPSYTSQHGEQYQWAPGLERNPQYQAPNYTPRLGSNLLQLLDQQRRGQPMGLADQSKWEEVMRGSNVPTRDWRTLPLDPANPTRPGLPSIGDPDYLPMLAQVHQAAQQGDEQAMALLPELRKFQELATYQSTFKQDPFNPFGDNLFGALGILGLGASAGAAAPLFAGTAGLAGTVGGIGALAGSTGQLASMFGQGLDLPALSKAGSVLGSLGGIASGTSGLANLLGTGVHSLADVGKLASQAGKITGSLGRLTDADPLKQAGKYLGLAGTLGRLGGNVTFDDIKNFLG